MTKKSISSLSQMLTEFAKERDWGQFHSPKNLSMALAVEVSEIVEYFQWTTEEQSYKLSSEKIEQVREEIGDALIYLTMLADKLEIDPLEAAFNKIEINRAKYPVSKAKGSAKKYNEL